ncbi:hypothetical protein [Arthrobacter glacialis]|uniref:hypothetical protein n=1 Tax=Arthrobacter glacialis TaxID=1664 RepID=UPI001056EE9B|nr:hypothetical protein [Arthrobacter glacialis]
MTKVNFGYAWAGVLALRQCHSCASEAAGNAQAQSHLGHAPQFASTLDESRRQLDGMAALRLA